MALKYLIRDNSTSGRRIFNVDERQSVDRAEMLVATYAPRKRPIDGDAEVAHRGRNGERLQADVGSYPNGFPETCHLGSSLLRDVTANQSAPAPIRPEASRSELRTARRS